MSPLVKYSSHRLISFPEDLNFFLNYEYVMSNVFLAIATSKKEKMKDVVVLMSVLLEKNTKNRK